MNNWLEQALKYESENNLLLSTQCYTRALKECPTDKDVLYFAGVFLFSIRNYEEALDIFVQCYSHEFQTQEKKKEILTNILAAYYEPNMEEFKKTYERNIKNLLAYEHNYLSSLPAFEDLPCICIPRNDYSYYIFDKHAETFRGQLAIQRDVSCFDSIIKNDCVIAIDVFDLKQLETLHEQTHSPSLNGEKVPIYLIWADTLKMQNLQLVDYEPIIATKRFVFLPDHGNKSGLDSLLGDHQSFIPTKFVGNHQYAEEIESLINEAVKLREQDSAQRLFQVRELAQDYDKKYYRELFVNDINKIRVLFITSRFTTFLQYSIRDCMAACKELGIECDVLIEKSDVNRIFTGSLLDKIAEFRPNVIFQIDYFKWQQHVIPENFMYVTWVQDPMPHIFNKNSAPKIRWNDFILTMTKTFRDDLVKLGYPEANILHQTVPVNPSIYYKRDVFGAEKEYYGADITLISHIGDPDGRLTEFSARCAAEISDSHGGIRELFHIAYDITYQKIEKSEPVFTVQDYRLVLEEAAKRCGIKLAITEDLAYEFGFQVGNPLHRTLPLTWLAEYGYGLKIWGKGWPYNKRLKDYAMGPAANGEEVAKILSCSKIALGIQPYTTMHPRVLEAMACGSLYICRNLPVEHDYDNIRNYFVEDEDFVCFYDKEDLLKKIDYYLKNEKEMRRIAENGRRKTIKYYTYKKAMQNCFSFIKTTLNRQNGR